MEEEGGEEEEEEEEGVLIKHRDNIDWRRVQQSAHSQTEGRVEVIAGETGEREDDVLSSPS